MTARTRQRRSLERRIGPGLVVALGLALGPAGPALAGHTPESRRAVEEYARELAAVRGAPAPVSLESLYVRAKALEEALVLTTVEDAGAAPYGNPSVIETLSDASLDSLQAALSGIGISVYEAVWAEPVPSFFASLAVEHGTPIDTLFFGLFQRTHADWPPALPSYLQAGPPYAACVRFGSGELVRFYEEWGRALPRLPEPFARTIRRELEDVATELEQGECACSDSGSVANELSRFLGRLPGDRLAPEIRARLEFVRSGKARIRYRCTPG